MYLNPIPILTNTKANNGSGAMSPPTTAATVPSEQVMSAAKPNAVNGDDITTGHWIAINTLHITIIPNIISRKSTVDCENKIKTQVDEN